MCIPFVLKYVVSNKGLWYKFGFNIVKFSFDVCFQFPLFSYIPKSLVSQVSFAKDSNKCILPDSVIFIDIHDQIKRNRPI